MRALPLALPLLLGAALAHAGSAVPYDEEPIRYGASAPDDPVARLAARLRDGRAALRRDGPRGYLDGLLRALGVPVSSQVLVFSKTSLQRELIGPANPRALYFNDEVYVGFVPGGEVIELAATDPRLGTIFYVVPQSGPPRLQRATHECLQCHDSIAFTGGVPGLVMRSVFPDRRGHPILAAGTFVTDQRSPMAERWGGWYATGTHGAERHMGNVTARETADGAALDRDKGANVVDLAGRFDASAYPGRGSDLVALMALAHQTEMHNRLTRAAFETRRALHDDEVMNRALGRAPEHRSETTGRRIAAVADAVVRYLLFSEEPALRAPVKGTSPFAAEFAARGPRDRRGRSLRDLDLSRRLLRHPCSWLVYGEAFDALPDAAREEIYRRLWAVLTGADRSPAFAHLGDADRRAIKEILSDTKRGLPRWWE